MMVLTDKPEIRWTNATLLVEELAEIYSTPTPKVGMKPKKVIGIDWLVVFLQ